MLSLAFLILGQVQPMPTLPELVALAAADCARLPHEAQRTARYLILPDEDFYRIILGHVPHICPEPDLPRLRRVGLKLVRLHIDECGWSRDLWESLTEQEPLFTIHLQVQAARWEWKPGPGIWRDPKTGITHKGSWIEHAAK